MAPSNHPLFRQRLALLRWLLPVVIGLLAVLYEVGLGRWIHDVYGDADYFSLDILFYAIVAPLLSFWVLTRIGHWFDEKEQAAQQAQASEQRLASITAASADAILGLDTAGRIESWNHGAELIFGHTTGQIASQPLARLLAPGEAAEVELRWLLDRARQDGFIRDYELAGRDANGRPLTLELTLTQVTGRDGRPQGFSAVLRDVSERRQREAEIRRLNASLSEQVAARTTELAEKVEQLAQTNAELRRLDQTRAEFVSLVSHQIRAPLSNMRGAVERMGVDCLMVNATCARMFNIMNQQAERLDLLVRDVLSAARIEAGELVLHAEPISVLPLVQHVAEQMRARWPAQRGGEGDSARAIRLPAKPGLPLVYADRDRVAEVLTNLLDNADKYSPPGREVSVDVRADQSEVTVMVQDAGPGLPADALEHVFEKFYRADSSDSQPAYGYGLGLYVCKRLVEAQGGQIWAENGPQGGAVFSFTLPVARDA